MVPAWLHWLAYHWDKILSAPFLFLFEMLDSAPYALHSHDLDTGSA